MSMHKIEGFEPMAGQHCETVTTGTLLKAAGVVLSEPMLFGLGEGLSFIFLNLAALPLPFVGGRVKPFELTLSLCRNIGATCDAAETGSKPKAWVNLEEPILRGTPVGLQLDCYYLDYFSHPVHFAGHFVAAYGFDESEVLVVDTVQQGTLQRAPRSRVEEARFAKGPMAARARSWTITAPAKPVDLPGAVRAAIGANAEAYLNPPFQGASYLGIRKMAASLPTWLKLSKSPEQDLAQTALMMERAGTGGAIFRNFYRDFLAEARDLLPQNQRLLREAEGLFGEAAAGWTAIADLIGRAGAQQDAKSLHEAAGLCTQVADLEVAAMQRLSRVGD